MFIAQQVAANSEIVNGAKNWGLNDDERNLKILKDTVAGFAQASNEIAGALTELINLGVSLIPGGTFVVSANDAYNGKVVSASIGFLCSSRLVNWASRSGENRVQRRLRGLYWEAHLGTHSKNEQGRAGNLGRGGGYRHVGEEAGRILKALTNIGIEEMHLPPQEAKLAQKFADAGLSIGEYTIYLDKALHRLKRGSGLHTNLGSIEGNWNAVWKTFFAQYPKADKADILRELDRMLKLFGLVE